MMYLLSPHLFLFVLPTISIRLPSIWSPFYEPYIQGLDNSSNITVDHPEIELKKRDGNCPVNYDSCSTLAAIYGGACCALGSICTTDGAHQVACCSMGAKCTGRLDRPSSTTSEGEIGGWTTTANNPALGPSPTMTSPAMTSSIVNNAYFPYPYIPTSYPDQVACFSALDVCQANYLACAANLQGTSYGVTIVAPAGGITVSPTAQILGASSATSICSSLSSRACHDIASSDCIQFQTSTSSPTVPNAAVRTTVGILAKVAIRAVIGWGIACQII